MKKLRPRHRDPPHNGLVRGTARRSLAYFGIHMVGSLMHAGFVTLNNLISNLFDYNGYCCYYG